MTLLKPILLGVASVACLAAGKSFATQEDDRSAAGPVYLEERPELPAPKIRRREKKEKKHEDGTLQSERNIVWLSDGTAMNDGKYVEYYQNGQKFVEGEFKMGAHEGPWQYWYDNGQLCKVVNFKKSRADGQWDVFRSDGTLQSRKSYKAGKRDGPWEEYYDDGKQVKIKVLYKDHNLHGERIAYHANGQKQRQDQFVDSALDGKVVEWDDAGNKTAEAVYAAGELQGNIIHYNK
ncbi:MAG: toxin-antitoxin system YwqK family antitoxin [Pirellulales bacterium]|nr:toxin-antitoxin system YwqK family antitoxin [Pirellulales bacterium]